MLQKSTEEDRFVIWVSNTQQIVFLPRHREPPVPKYDDMKLVIREDIQEIGRETTKWCVQNLGSMTQTRSLYLPAGQTPVEVYRQWEAEPPEFLKNAKLIQIDDVLTGQKQGMFRKFFEEKLPSFLDRFEWIEEGATSAELGILGLGLNGHIAFHEPGLPSDFFSGCVQLNPVTRKTLDLEDDAWGITYGAGAFLRCHALLMIVSGSSKREVLRRLMTRDPNLPASVLASHPNFIVIADKLAAEGL